MSLPAEKPTYASVVRRSLTPPAMSLDIANVRENLESSPKGYTASSVVLECKNNDNSPNCAVKTSQSPESTSTNVTRPKQKVIEKFLPGGRTKRVVVRESEPEDLSGSSSEPDAGARLDPNDRGYRGRPLNKRVGDERTVTQSIIQTRSARKASMRNESKRSDIPSEPVSQAPTSNPAANSSDTVHYVKGTVDHPRAEEPSAPGTPQPPQSSTPATGTPHADHDFGHRRRRRDDCSDRRTRKPRLRRLRRVHSDSDGSDTRDVSMSPFSDRNIDEYDLTDPFIDDSAVVSDGAEDGQQLSTQEDGASVHAPSDACDSMYTSDAGARGSRSDSDDSRAVRTDSDSEPLYMPTRRRNKGVKVAAKRKSRRDSSDESASDDDTRDSKRGRRPKASGQTRRSAKLERSRKKRRLASVSPSPSDHRRPKKRGHLDARNIVEQSDRGRENSGPVSSPARKPDVPIHVPTAEAINSTSPPPPVMHETHPAVPQARAAGTSASSPANVEKRADSAAGASSTTGRRTFANTVRNRPAAPASATGQRMPTLDDLQYRRPDTAPPKCEVTNEALQDPELEGQYDDLPPLYATVFEAWTDQAGPGMMLFSKWREVCPNMSYESCWNAVKFRNHKNFINPSRFNPLDVLIRSVPGAKAKYNLHMLDRQPAVCLSAAYLKESHVIEPPERGLKQKSVHVILHTLDYERMAGFMGTAFGHRTLHAQLGMDALQITTKADFRKNAGSRATPTTPSRVPNAFSNVRSPAVSSRPNAYRANYSDGFALEADAEIPVFDCRSIDVVFERDLDRLEQLPRWQEEIPEGSFVVVAYTVTVYRAEKTKAWTISFNLRWVMLIGTPDDVE